MKGNRKSIRWILMAVLAAICLSVAGCSDDSNAIGQVADNGHDHDHDHDEGIPAWIWGYDADSGILTAYHSDGGRKRATFAAHIHPMIKIAYAPSDSRPTLWMASGHMAQAFTSGFSPHMDHVHMATPEKHAALSGVHNPAHMSVSPDGGKVIFANDENSTLTVADTASGDVAAVISHGSPHSAALMTNGGLLVTTHMGENWAKIVEVPTDAVLAEIPIGSGAHGDAYYAATGRAFIACVEGIEVIDTVSMMKTARLPYPAAGRTSFLYHAGETPTAVGLHNLSVDGERQETDSFLLIDMMAETIEAVSIPGASLDWSSRDGRFALSQDGRTAVFSDLNASRIYVVDVDPDSVDYRSVTTITVPAPGVAVGAGERGEHLFILAGTTVYPVDLDHGEVDMAGAFAVKEGTDWIYVTSFSGEVIDESVDMGDTVLNPEDADTSDDHDDHDHDTHSVEGRLLVSDLNNASLTQVDLDTGEIMPQRFVISGAAAMYASPSGRFALALQGGDLGRVDLYDGGIYLESHGDHYHEIETDLSFLTFFEGVSPVHVVSRGRYMTVHFDKSDTDQVLILDEYQMALDMEDGTMDETPVSLSPGKQHGAAVPIGDDLFVITTPTPAYLNGETRNPLPHGVHVRNLNDEVLFGLSNELNSDGVYESVVVGEGDAACDGLHGEFGNGKTSVFGCRGGVRVIAMTEFEEFETYFIDNPLGPETFYFDEAGAEDKTSEEIFSSLRIGSARGSDHLDHYFGHMTYRESSGGIYLIDPVNRGMSLAVPSNASVRPTAYEVDHEGKYLIVMMSDGVIQKYDAATGDLVAEQPDAFTPVTDFSDHGKYFPGLALGFGKIFYADPKTGAVVQMDMETLAMEETYELGGEPSEIAILGAVKSIEE